MDSVVWRAMGFFTAGAWAWLAFFRGGFWRLRERLRAGTPKGAHTVTAIIPARDERDFIGRAVGSLQAQRYPVRVIVADDESTDGTAEASHADLAVRVTPRPPGWKGKLWAVSSGIQADDSPPEYYLLTDADIEHVSPDLLPALLAQAEHGFDLVSIMAQLRCESVGEQLLIPAFVFFFFMLYPPRWIAAGKGSAAAAGGCILIRREMLERIGGIASIRNALIDDCALAARVRASGGRVWLGISELPIRSIRPYGGFSGIRGMIARSAFAQLRHFTLLLLGTVIGMLLIYVAPALLWISGDLLAAALGFAAWLLSAILYLPSVRLYRAPLWTAFALPAIAIFYLIATIESALQYWTGKGGQWKGRIQDAG
ncbi:MAG TPA: glycosyltransferase [Bryobacteraceae bacterium]|nr:glycosyltransferase [Bryobacteraceae bacterium]